MERKKPLKRWKPIPKASGKQKEGASWKIAHLVLSYFRASLPSKGGFLGRSLKIICYCLLFRSWVLTTLRRKKESPKFFRSSFGFYPC